MYLLAKSKKWWHFMTDFGNVVEVSRDRYNTYFKAIAIAREKALGK